MKRSDMSPPGKISGSKIALVPADRAHEDAYRGWFNDFQVQRTSGLLPMPWSDARFNAWFTRRVIDSDDTIWFTIVENQTGRCVGFAGIRDIDFRHRTAEYFISIGEAKSRGKGFGTEATILTLEYAFTMLNLHNIFLDVSSASIAGVRTYEKAGFQVIGQRTESLIMGGNLYDWVYMECLSTEFQHPRGNNQSSR